MADIALIWNSSLGFADIATLGSDLRTDDGLQTALIISLFTDRRASDDELPDGETDRRGWWGDVVAPPGDQIGSLLWTLQREKTLANVIVRANRYAKECVKWIIDDKVATRIETIAESTRFEELDIRVAVYRPNGKVVNSRYFYNWQAQTYAVIE